MGAFLAHKGIACQTTNPYTPQQNGVAERRNGIIKEKSRCLLRGANLNAKFWQEAAAMAVYLMNMTYSESLKDIPYRKWTGKDPDTSRARTFGCIAFRTIPSDEYTSFDKRGSECIFTGYTKGKKGYELFDLHDQKKHNVPDASFHEDKFSAGPRLPQTFHELWSAESVVSGVQGGSWRSLLYPPVTPSASVTPLETSIPTPLTPETPSATETHPATDIGGNHEPQPTSSTPLPASQPDEMVEHVPTATRHELTDPVQPAITTIESNIHEEEEIVIDSLETIPGTEAPNSTAPNPEARHEQDTPAKPAQPQEEPDPTPPPRRSTRTRIPVSKSFYGYIAEIPGVGDLEVEIPLSYTDALSSEHCDHWKEAMDEEIQNFTRHAAFDIVDIPPNVSPIPSRWTFTLKKDQFGVIQKFKARFVAKGFKQICGRDYDEDGTYAPVLTAETFRLVISSSAENDWDIHQMDVTCAFLQADLKEEVFAKIPQGYNHGKSMKNKCWKMNKAIYGLKQAPKAWFDSVHTTLNDEGFTQSQADQCLFTRIRNGKIIVLCVFVDDFILTGDDTDGILEIKKQMAERYNLKDLGLASRFIGVNIIRDRPNRVIYLNQHDKIKKILETYKMSDAKPCSTPIEKGYTPPPFDPNLPQTDAPLLQAIGSLNHLSCWTRPDIEYASSISSQFMRNGNDCHWELVKRIMQYLKGTKNLSLRLGGRRESSQQMPLVAFCDADFAGSKSDSKSRSSYVISYLDGPISWHSKKQATVAQSTAEAEYISASKCAIDVQWILELMADIGVRPPGPVTIHEDNQAAIKISKCAAPTRTVRHLGTKVNFIRSLVHKNMVNLVYCESKDNVADIGTKALGPEAFLRCRSVLGMDYPKEDS